MFKAEWEYLKKHKFFMLVIVVLFFVPSIYAVTFLSSLWDPYGQVKNLPVAIINKDKSVTYEGQKLAVGDDLEKELRKSKDMDFHFPSEKEAKAGLKDGKYYTVITIPSDFSKDATTLLDKDPKQMKLDYETSSGHSFIAGKLSESGAKEISQQISKQVTKTYAKTIFAEMKKVGKGMNTAADANKQLADGTTQIKSGSDQLTSGLQTLSASTLQFNDGAQTLTQGLSQYVDGVAQADAGSQRLTAGLGQLNGQVPALVSGVGQLSNGSNQVTAGLGQLNSQVPALASGVNQLATGSEQLTNGVDQLNQQLKDQDFAGKITTLQTQVATLQDIAKDMPSQAQLQSQLQTVQTHLDNLNKASEKDAAAMPANVDKAFADAGVQVTPEQKAKIAASLATDVNNSETSKQIDPIVKDIAALSAQINTFNNAHGDQIMQLGEAAKNTDLNEVNTQLEQMKALPTAIDTVDENMHKLSDGLNTLNGNTGALSNGVSALTNGSTQVSDGLNTLNSKTGDLSNGASQLLAGSSQLTTGLDTLNSKRGELSSGAGQLADGARKLNGGANQLTAGAEQLSPALAKVQAGNQTLADKMGSAAKQVNDTKATNKTFKQIAAPATAKQTEKDHVANNGTGMVPYMFSVAMFVGMMALNLMLDMISPRTKISSLAAWMGSKMVMLFGIAVMAATVLYGLSISILGLDPIHPLQTYGFMILISLMDAALVTAIYMWFDKAGAFAAMVLLVFQLSGSAGTYPIQLSNAFFEWLHPYLPMTYTVDGLRETIMIGGSAMPQVEVLFSVFVVSVIAMVIYYVSHRRHYSMMQDIAEA
ncbi:YhgE/Pip domain-containing protein [Weissella confusa]|uniref:YhgE/Pip domain-containing protein n=1 Tax=Weissella confusa TaxID=1583 RepID=UPI000704FD68|nr:YhgE/Pip domain-containing protein [Weissella confusa]KRN21932.1 integral membrane protein [Weissella confusa]MBD5833652.1 YhgE/Pip domain-containing protein [Weissella confusa]MBJ7631244.1 YhgE/Pip domain-containing protein [Weissella confusa]MBJ7635451.1 YhgE/Pip domain-containing protein [Weissella confusa]MBJ7641737.1 YhgE/Pip domain-containing protein [Weissella confusa]